MGGSLPALALGETADFEIKLAAAPEPVPVGADLTYTITVTNHGPSASTAQVIDALPPTVTFKSALPAGDACSVQLNLVTCTVPNLSSGDVHTITVVVQTTQQGSIVNSAGVNEGLVLDPDPTNNLALRVSTVTNGSPGPGPGQADFAVALKASPEPVAVGDPLTYTITVSNHGPDASTGQVVDALPLTVTYVSSSPPGDDCTLQLNVIVTCNVPSLSNGDVHTIRLVVTPTQTGSVIDTATVNQGLVLDPDPTNNIAIVVSTVVAASPSPSPAPTPSSSPSPSGTTPVGGVDTGAGGTAGGSPLIPLLLLTGLAAAGVVLLRQRLVARGLIRPLSLDLLRRRPRR
jgi:uncharacterized repeat protein (TIGR01451 family)